MKGLDRDMVFSEQMERIKLVTGARTQAELAGFFGIGQGAISDARRRGKIPSPWLVLLTAIKNVRPEWVLAGEGPCYLQEGRPDSGRYETGEQFAKRRADEEALKRLPARALADELVRRIVVSQEEAVCSKNGK